MATISEIDPYYIKGISALHSKDHLILGNKPLLQSMLEEAIKSKTGQEKNLTPIVQSLLKHTNIETVKLLSDEHKLPSNVGSDNELELDLLKEDLMCIVCQGIDVTARNRLLECSDCRCLYHQECHQPAVTQNDADLVWVCSNCKRTPNKSPISSSGYTSSSSKSKSSPSHSSSSRHGEKGSYSKSSKSGSSKSSSSSKMGKSSSSSSSSTSSNSSKHTPVVSTSSTIQSADKRIQNMKKKAAKLHEKKKMPR